MKKWLVLTICACLLTGCTRYNPIDITDSALENASPSEPDSADTTDGTGADDGAGTSDSDEAEEPVLQITDDDRTNRREPVKVKGIYVSAYVAGNETMMDNIIKEIDATELNAVVIDFKNDDGRITAPIDSELFNEIGACKAYIPDMKALTDKLKEHDIYAIARIVAFKDPYLAEKKPEWSLKKADGSIYRDKKWACLGKPIQTGSMGLPGGSRHTGG